MYFTEERIKRILSELEKFIYPDSEQIKSYKMKKGNKNDLELPDEDAGGWDAFSTDLRWGGKDLHFWFKTEVAIPSRFNGKTVIYQVRTGREGQWDATNPQFIVYVNGKIVQGLDVNHREIILTSCAKAEERYSIALHAYSGMQETPVELNSVISTINRDIEKLYYNVKVPLEVAILLDKDDKKRLDILKFLNETVNILDLRKPFSPNFDESVIKAGDYLEREFYQGYCGCEDVTATCVGHTHIDVAWLWTLDQTREKTVRSFSTVLNLMREYPEYIFMSSQPQLYKFIKEDQPAIYEEIRQRVKEGRWEPEGAMWLEADCNLSSGESLVRQVLFGTRFFEKEFGIKNKILWLPDVFGYSAALPQILKKSGIDYFMTTKISWNEYNKMPCDTFMWKGMDGTEILTHFITSRNYEHVPTSHFTTYNAMLNPSQVMGAWQRYQHKGLNDDVLICYGYGDGGGGPTKEMLENARRLEKGIPGAPKVKMGKALDYFKKLDDVVKGQKDLPKWVGELYLEYHRGTYTSMARNKKFNRKSEFLYQDAELLSVINMASAGISNYPQAKINEGWETILLNQFHDILPGSSIKEVYEDSKEQYLKVLDSGEQIVSAAMADISGRIGLNDNSIVVFNQLGFTRTDIAEFDMPDGFHGIEIMDYSGRVIPSQVVQNEGTKKVIFLAEYIPAKGYKAFKVSSCSTTISSTWHAGESNMEVSREVLRNKFFDVGLDKNANMISIHDRINNRELLQEGQRANVFQAFEDKPHKYDAWDINIYYQEKMWELNEVESIEVLEEGPVRSAVRVKRKFLDSQLVQDIFIYNDIPRIDFTNLIDWKEKQILLKVAFPVDIHAEKATYEIQYGNVERPTHWNTSWDFAKFEVCAHKWADLSEDGYGVSLLNDCKYGHDIKDGVMRLTLLKSATSPNVDADREVHQFTYSIYPHAGNWKQAGTVQMAYSLNCPMYVKLEDKHHGTLPLEFSLLKVDRENVVIEVIKKAEDSDNIIIRMYECYNRRTAVKATFFKEISGVWECDLLENDISRLDTNGSSFDFEIKPYEIKTFKIEAK